MTEIIEALQKRLAELPELRYSEVELSIRRDELCSAIETVQSVVPATAKIVESPPVYNRCLCNGVGCNTCEPRGNYSY